MWQTLRESKLLSFLSLFTSFSTLLCCAIPSCLVLLGFGASLAGFLGKYPQLTWPSENKNFIFSVSFVILGISYVSLRYSQKQVCPADKKKDCSQTKKWSSPLFLIALGLNLLGAFYAFVLPHLL
jgi:hypothetical protein